MNAPVNSKASVSDLHQIPAVQPAGDDAGRGGSSSLRSARHWIIRWMMRTEDSLIGDLIAGVCMVIIAAAIVIFTGVLG